MAYTDQQIRDALASNPNASASDIYNAMQKYGVSMEQLSSATGKSQQDLASQGLSGGLSMQQLGDVGYNPATLNQTDYSKPNTFGYNALGSPAFQRAATGGNSMGTTGQITAEDIRRQMTAAQQTGSDAGAITWANANGVSADMIDSAMGWSKGSTANYLSNRPEGKVALYGMPGYFTNGADQNAPMYSQAKQFENSGVLSNAPIADVSAINSQRVGGQTSSPVGNDEGGVADYYDAMQPTFGNAQPDNGSGNNHIGLISSGMTGHTLSPLYSGFNASTDTTRGQVDSMLQQDSEYLQNARTKAMQGMNARGTLNSSMANEAGVKAGIDAAALIGDATANQYQKAKLTTQELNSRMDLANLDADTRLRIADIANNMDQQKLDSANSQSVLNNYRMIAADTNQMINAILVSPNLTPEAKQQAINEALMRHDEYISFQDGITGYNLSSLISYA